MALAKGAGTAKSSRKVTMSAVGTSARKAVIFCSVVLLSMGSLPAQAASASALALQPVLTPAAPEVPSAEEIAAAKADEQASALQVARIEQILEAAESARQATFVLSMQANNAYGEALVDLENREAAADVSASKAEAAKNRQQLTRKEVGQLAGDLYRNGGLNPSLETFISGEGNAMQQAATLEAISAVRTRAFESAATAASAADSLTASAAEARKAADAAAAIARMRRAEAEEANAASVQAVSDAQAQRSVLISQLATLRNTTAELESERIAALEQQRAEERMAKLHAAAELAAAEQAARDAADSSSVNNTSDSVKRPAPVRAPAPASAPVPAAPAPAPNPAPVPAAPAPVPVPAASAPAPVPAAPAPAPEPAPPAEQPEPEPAAPPAPAPPAPVPAPAPAQPASPAGANQAAVSFALSKVGAPHFYQWGGTGPNGYDCSGLVYASFSAAGKGLPRTATAQYAAAPTLVPVSQAQPGDLMFWGSEGNFYHVAIYLGGGQVVQALNPAEGIDVTELRWMMGAPHHYAARY